MSCKIPIKALSVNALYRGRRFKTATYAKYQRDLQLMLPSLRVPAGKLSLRIVFGVSNPRADLDNLLKGTVDGLMAKYGFDDSRIYALMAHKVVVPKGQEYIDFAIGSAR